MNCPLCNRKICNPSLVGPYHIYSTGTTNPDEPGRIEVCGQCFILTRILDLLKSVVDKEE